MSSATAVSRRRRSGPGSPARIRPCGTRNATQNDHAMGLRTQLDACTILRTCPEQALRSGHTLRRQGSLVVVEAAAKARRCSIIQVVYRYRVATVVGETPHST